MAYSLTDRIGLAASRIRMPSPAMVAIGVVGMLLAMQLSRLLWLFVTPVGPVGNWRAPSAEILPPAARIALFGSFDPFFRTDAVVAGSENITSLSLVLFGIRSNESSGDGSAIIAGEDGVQKSYAVGEEVMPGVILDAVAFDHVVLSRGGVKESLYIDQSVPAETVGGAPATPAPATAAPASGAALNAETLQKSVGFAPRNEGGKVTGFVLTPNDDGTMMRLAGFQPGDVIVGINGRPVTSASDISSQIKPGARVSIEVERGAQKLPIALSLEQP